MAYIETADAQSISAHYIASLQNDLEDKIDDLQDLVTTTSYSDIPSLLVDTVSSNIANSFGKAIDLIGDLTYTPVDQPDVISIGDPETTHTYISSELDTMQNNLINLLSSYGSEELKNINGLPIKDSLIAAILDGSNNNKTQVINDCLEMLDRYQAPSTQANKDWLTVHYNWLLDDSISILYKSLFDMAQNSAQWASKTFLSIEALHMSFTLSNNDLLTKLLNSSVTQYHGEIDAQLGILKANIDKINASVDVNITEKTAEMESTKLAVSQRNARLEAYVKTFSDSLSTTVQNLDAAIENSIGISKAYQAIATAYASRYSTVVLGRQ